MDTSAALAAFDQQVRRSTVPPQPGWRVEWAADGRILRVVGPPEHEYGCFVIWSRLDEADADEVIEQQLSYFGGLDRSFEWKWFGYDEPGDLRARLGEAGLQPDDDESLVVGDVETVVSACGDEPTPDGVVLRHMSGETLDDDLVGIVTLNKAVWGQDLGWVMDELRAERKASPDALRIHVAEAEGEVVCAAWVRFHPGTAFASLWGGATLPQWRGRGIYRALVARRAMEARERGFRYLQVDASPDSRPILERLGMVVLTTTTPYRWTP